MGYPLDSWLRRYIRPTTLLDSWAVIVLLGLLLTTAAPPAFPQAPHSRGEALAKLRSPDALARADAVVWLAGHGAMPDARLLQERLRDADESVRAYAEQGLWILWTRSGDKEIDALMARGAEESQAGHYAESIATYSAVIRRKPAFAEGWNRRATVRYLAGDYPNSIVDCGEVLKRNPGHFGALSGLGQIHTRLEEYAEALKWFQRALEANPNMAGVEFNILQLRELLRQQRGRSI